MRRTRNDRFTGENYYSTKPTFKFQRRWLAVRYTQASLCIICLAYLAMVINSPLSNDDDDDAPKLIKLKGAWGYFLVIAIFSIYALLSLLSFLFICYNITLSPLQGFGIDILCLIIWPVALAAETVAYIGYSTAAAKITKEEEEDSIRGSPRVAHIIVTVALAVCVITSIYGTYLSYTQLRESRKRHQRSRSLESAAPLFTPSPSSPSSSAPTTTPPYYPPQSPPTAQSTRPPSTSSTLWSRIRPISSATTIFSPTRQNLSGEEEEPKPETEETTAQPLTREQIIAQRVEAVRAPPTYWYATSGRPRVDGGVQVQVQVQVQRDPEAGDEELPLYRA